MAVDVEEPEKEVGGRTVNPDTRLRDIPESELLGAFNWLLRERGMG